MLEQQRTDRIVSFDAEVAVLRTHQRQRAQRRAVRDTRTAEAVDAGHDRAGNTWQDFEAGLDRRSERSASSRDELKFHWETLKDQAEARDLGGMGYELLAALSSWNVVWDQWWHEAKMTNEP